MAFGPVLQPLDCAPFGNLTGDPSERRIQTHRGRDDGDTDQPTDHDGVDAEHGSRPAPVPGSHDSGSCRTQAPDRSPARESIALPDNHYALNRWIPSKKRTSNSRNTGLTEAASVRSSAITK